MIFPDEKIRVILKAMDIEDESISFDEECFHTTLYEYKRDYPEFLEEFSFLLNGTFPYSELLERILNRAKISRALKTVNPDFADVQLRKGTSEYVKNKIEHKFSEDDLKALYEIGRSIKNRLKGHVR